MLDEVIDYVARIGEAQPTIWDNDVRERHATRRKHAMPLADWALDEHWMPQPERMVECPSAVTYQTHGRWGRLTTDKLGGAPRRNM